MSKLPFDCLYKIFELLEEDKTTLHSCLLVNRLWCEIAVRVLWRDITYNITLNIHTLIACLPEESKEILRKNEIIVSPPTSKPPIFNYTSFCKVLSVGRIYKRIGRLLKQSDDLPEDILEHKVFIV